MKKQKLLISLIVAIGGIFGTTCFAASETTTFQYDTTTSLTKNIVIDSGSATTVNWGDGSTENFEVGATINHTYQNSGVYSVSITSENVRKLNVSNNDIFEIDVSQLLSLEELDISDNKLSDLNLTSNTILSIFNCSNNNFTELPTIPQSITVLKCSNNTIKNIAGLNDFDLSGYVSLKTLECMDNDISGLILSNCSSLEQVNCINNYITNILLDGCNNIKEIYCSSNKISSLDLSSCTLLEKLNCIANDIVNLDLSNNSNLKELYLYGNNISSLDLYSINLEFVLLDNSVTVTNNNSNTLITVEINGNGGMSISSSKLLTFSEVPEKIVVNASEVSLSKTLDISGYTGNNVITIEFIKNETVTAEKVNSPQVIDGMIPVKHNGTNWVITNAMDSEWYSYSELDMKWANVMLRDGTKYLDLDGTTLKDVGDTELASLIGREIPEEYAGSMYVWIPRYTYKIESNDIKIKYSEGFSDFTTDEYLDYRVHPAFNYAPYEGGNAEDTSSYEYLSNANKYLGIWVAKYPAKGSVNNPKYSSNGESLTDVSIGNAFVASQLTAKSTTYGIKNAVSHMIKNTEWGAVAYFTTAVGSLKDGSTTNNIYGIYDMDNNAEYVANFVELVGGISNISVRKNGRNLLPYTMITYNYNEVSNTKDIDILRLKSEIDSADSNYNVLNSFYGYGINEVESAITGTITKDMPTGNNAFFTRGIDGIYSYSGSDGSSANNIGFRNVIFGTTNSSNVYTNTYTIKASSSEGGRITPSGNVVVEEGKSISFSMVADSEEEIVDVIVDGKSVLYDLIKYDTYAVYTFENVNRDHTIYVSFDGKVLPYEVKVIKNPENIGTISGEGIYNSRSTVTLGATGTDGYKFSSWEIVEGLSDITNQVSEEISFKMPSNDVTLKANFEIIMKALLRIETDNTKAFGEENVGTLVDIKAEVKEDFEFAGWVASGVTLTEEQRMNPSLQITMPSNDVQFVAEYNKMYSLITELGDGTIINAKHFANSTIELTAPAQVDGKAFWYWDTSGVYGVYGADIENNVIRFEMPNNPAFVKAVYRE